MIHWRKTSAVLLSAAVFAFATGWRWAAHHHVHDHEKHDSEHCTVCQSFLSNTNPAILSVDLPVSGSTLILQISPICGDSIQSSPVLTFLIRGPPVVS